MPYVIGDPCIGVKDNSCTEVCPVDCIHPLPDEPGYVGTAQLFIDPGECIECDACVAACPVEAIRPGELVPDEWHNAAARNAAFFAE